METIADASIDAIVTDPPYEIGFNGVDWDRSGISFHSETWAAVRRVLKPGGYLLAFTGARTYHRIAVAIEDAGFTIENYLEWIYGSGMPHGLNVSKALDRADGVEGVLLDTREMADPKFTRPGFSGPAHSKIANQKKLVEIRAPASEDAKQWDGWHTALKPAHEPIVFARNSSGATVISTIREHGTGALNIEETRVNGRWPSNVLFSHLPECEGSGVNHTDLLCAAACPVRELELVSEGAARFFYIAKPRTRERIGGTLRNLHPTVKPVDLMRHLVRLVTPPGGVVLDPFAGSGTTGCAAMVEGIRFIGIEQDPESHEIALARIADYAFAHGRGRPSSD